MAEYIEREATLKLLRGASIAKYPSTFGVGILAAVKEIVDIPAADVDPVVHGRWEEGVEIQTDTSTLYDYTCSVCSIVTTRESPYCPNCGARMDGEGDV